MRDLKFRAWDKENKKWLHSYKELGGCSIMGETILCGEWMSEVGLVRLNDVDVMQFIGRHDHYNKEIYEGDIARRVNTLQTTKFVVEYRNDKEFTGFLPVEQGKDTGLSRFIAWNDLEIIGNIKENPELLSKETV